MPGSDPGVCSLVPWSLSHILVWGMLLAVSTVNTIVGSFCRVDASTCKTLGCTVIKVLRLTDTLHCVLTDA